MSLKNWYFKNYKKFLIIPLALLIISSFIIYNQYKTTNDIMNKDVSLKGGITATIYTKKKINTEILQSTLKNKFKNSDIFVRRLTDFTTKKQLGIIIEASEIQSTNLKKELENQLKIKLTQENYSIEQIGSSLGSSFYNEMLKALLLAFIFMAIATLITFRTIIPSLAVVSAALLDIIATLAIINLLQIKISAAGIAAFLLLTGYSIDTDVLLTTRILKRKENPLFERIKSAVKTGLTMTITTITALTIAYIATTHAILKQIFLIIIIGLIIDIISTYLMNLPILTLYTKNET